MMYAQTFFTSIDDIVLLANDAQSVSLCNYNKDVHRNIFLGLDSFLRIPSSFATENLKLGSCFSDVPNHFILDQQTMLNIRILLEVLKLTSLNMSKEAQDAHNNLQ